MTDPSPIAAIYDERAARFERAAALEAAASARLSRARLTLVLLVLIGGGVALWRPPLASFALGLSAASLTALLVAMVRHERVEQRREAADALARLNREGAARVRRHWNELPPAWAPEGLDDHPYATDLDLFGHASLEQIVGPVRTPAGRTLLCRWLLVPDSTTLDDLPLRQEAVRELAPQLDFRQQFSGLSRRIEPPATLRVDDEDVSGGNPEIGHFVRWAETPSFLLQRPWISALAIALAVLTIGFAVLMVTGRWENSLWLLTGTAGWALRWYVHPHVDAAFGGADAERGLRSFTALIALIAGPSFESRALRACQAALHGRGGHAHAALRRLEQLSALADIRLSAWVYMPLQTFTLWDFHVWLLIDRWRRTHGVDVRYWLASVGHAEALSSLASLAHDHPHWSWPSVTPGATGIDARDLGHPLLSDALRVTNDLTVGPRGRFLLITGSNMSGKSTLLRAVGLNLVLARAGAPVCASAFTAPPAALHTSMRVADSLEQGLSLFMASLTRLQRVVRAAREATATRPVCYLLDEVLQGTNSAERQIAVRTIVGHLLACHAIGAVTTHDLELAADPSFTASAESVHLQETLGHDGDRVTMTFDYRLRPGPASAGNALQLLKMLGLD